MTPSEVPAPVVTGHPRYDWQIECCHRHEGLVLNVGCNEDPAKLQARFGDRIVNCDLEAIDEHMGGRPNATDRVFNCLDFPWPCEDDEAELVIFGDILEHFTEAAMVLALEEARRVGSHVGITVPEDTRIDEPAEQEKWKAEAYNLHTTVVTREIIERAVRTAGWKITDIYSAPWHFDGITGWCVLAVRA